MAYAQLSNSPRLRSTLRALQHAGEKGLTGLELCLQASIMNPGEATSELRRNGYNITATEEAQSANRRRVFRYRLIPDREDKADQANGDREPGGGVGA